jgi:hypothetical protein
MFLKMPQTNPSSTNLKDVLKAVGNFSIIILLYLDIFHFLNIKISKTTVLFVGHFFKTQRHWPRICRGPLASFSNNASPSCHCPWRGCHPISILGKKRCQALKEIEHEPI